MVRRRSKRTTDQTPRAIQNSPKSSRQRLAGFEPVEDRLLLASDFVGAPQPVEDAGTLAGYVFQMELSPQLESELLQSRLLESLRSPATSSALQPVEGVILELRDATTGNSVHSSEAIGGGYADGPIRVATDEVGYYEFSGLPANDYAIYQVLGGETLDAIDSGATLSGFTFNLGEHIESDDDPAFQHDRDSDFDSDSEANLEEDNQPLRSVAVPAGAATLAVNFFSVDSTQSEPPQPQPESLPLSPPAILIQPFLPSTTSTPATIRPPQPGLVEFGPTVSGARSPLPQTTVDAADRDGFADGYRRPSRMESGDQSFAQFFTEDEGAIGLESVDAKLGEELPSVTDDQLPSKPLPELQSQHFPSPPYIVGIENSPQPTSLVALIVAAQRQATAESVDAESRVPTRTEGDEEVLWADWNGDGQQTIGVFANGTWRIDADGDRRWSPKDHEFVFGREGDFPMVGDWNADGIADVAVQRAERQHLTMILDADGDRRPSDGDIQATRKVAAHQSYIMIHHGNAREAVDQFHGHQPASETAAAGEPADSSTR